MLASLPIITEYLIQNTCFLSNSYQEYLHISYGPRPWRFCSMHLKCSLSNTKLGLRQQRQETEHHKNTQSTNIQIA